MLLPHQQMRSIGEAAFEATKGRSKDLCLPYTSGQVSNWDAMECIWAYCFDECLRVDTTSTHVFLTEALHPPKAVREKTAEVMFEGFDVAGMYLHVQPPLALYASGFTSGVVVDSGHHSTSIFPVCDGYQLRNASIKVSYGGSHITELLYRLLHMNRTSWSAQALTMDTARDIKEHCGLVKMEFTFGSPAKDSWRSYTLPDGSVIRLKDEPYRCAEKIFQPQLDERIVNFNEVKPLPELVLDSIANCDMDMRKTLVGKVALTGGNTMFEGMKERLSLELKAMLPPVMAVGVEVHAPVDRSLTIWKGGAVLAGLSTFDDEWVTRAEYLESGPGIIHERCPVYL